MKFELAYNYMLKGEKVKRPCFKGYWYIDGVNGALTIHLANGKEITEGNLGLTVANTLADDWMIVRTADNGAKEPTLEEILDEFAKKFVDEIEGR